MPRDLMLTFDGRRLTGPLDDLYDLREVLRHNAPDGTTPEEHTRNLSQTLALAAQATRKADVFLASFADGSRVVFVRRCPPGFTPETAARTALRDDDREQAAQQLAATA